MDEIGQNELVGLALTLGRLMLTLRQTEAELHAAREELAKVRES